MLYTNQSKKTQTTKPNPKTFALDICNTSVLAGITSQLNETQLHNKPSFKSNVIANEIQNGEGKQQRSLYEFVHCGKRIMNILVHIC